MTINVFSQTDMTISARAQYYNNLPSVEDADADVRENDSLALAEKVLVPIFLKHGVMDICGINLLHQHWLLEDDEIAEQIRRDKGGEFWLETRPVSDLTMGSAPASWAICGTRADNILIPFEFSTDETARRCALELLGKPEFLKEAKAAMKASGLDRHFGLCVPLRDLLRHHEDYRLIEFSSERGRKSTIKPISADRVSEGIINTVWMFKLREPEGEVEANASVDCKPQTMCEATFSCSTVIVGCVTMSDGKHGQKLEHNREVDGHQEVDPN
jgi:hypothetical protein